MTIPEVGAFKLHQSSWYVCRTRFNIQDQNGKNSESSLTGNQLAQQTYDINPADLGVKDGDEVTYYLWVMASTHDQTAKESFIFRTESPVTAVYTCTGATVSPTLTFNGLTPPPVSEAQMQIASKVGDAVCQQVQSNRQRGVDNPTLLALQKDPLAVLEQNGMPSNFFEGALPEKMTEYVNYLKTQATNEINALKKRQQPRGFFRCWACRIGFGAVLALIGLALSAVTVGVGGAIFTASVNFLVTWGVAMATAQGAMMAATTVGGVALGGGIAALIEFICEKIPDTC